MGLIGSLFRSTAPGVARPCGASHTRPAVAFLLLLAGVSPLGASPQTSQWRVASARMVVELIDADGAATVRVDYLLVGGLPGSAVPLQLLGFAAATTEEVTVAGLGDVILWPASGSLRAASFSAPDHDPGSPLRLSVGYRIAHAVEGEGPVLRVRIPVAVVPLPTAEGVEAPFEARVRLPNGWTLSEAFPSGFRADSAGDQVVSLAVIPSVVGFRANTDGQWRLGFPLVVHLLMATILIAFGWRGLRHLRKLAA